MTATGIHIRSIRLFVMVFSITEIKPKTTTAQIAYCEKDNNCGNNNSDLTSTIIASKLSTTIFTNATILIFGGYFPGYFPPIEAAPQGRPMARHPWKITTIVVAAV